MVSSRVQNKILMLAALLIFGCRLALSYPSVTSDDDDIMMNDEYDYHEDLSSPSQQTKPSSIAKPVVPQQNRSLSVTGILGQDVVLQCGYNIGKDNVILWYKDTNLISNGNSLVLTNFNLNSTNYDLTILKSSPQSAGNYYCQVEPEHVYIHTKVILGDHSMDVITPESSKSGQSSIHGISLSAIILLALQLFKH